MQPNHPLDLSPEGDRLLAAALDRAREAVRLDDELRDAIQERINAVLIPVVAHLAPDRSTVRFRVGTMPELADERWVFRLADVLHHYRSALDNMLWAIAVGTISSMTESEARQVQFPLTNSDGDFDRTLRKSVLGRLPSVVQERLRATQPLVLRHRPADSILHWLHGLDVADKHRAALTLEVRARHDSLFHFLLLDEAGEDVEPSEWRTTYDGTPLRTGLDLAEAISPRRLAMADAVNLQPRFWVRFGELDSDIVDLLDALRPQILSVFELLQWGVAESISDAKLIETTFGPWNASRRQQALQQVHELLDEIDLDEPMPIEWNRKV